MRWAGVLARGTTPRRVPRRALLVAFSAVMSALAIGSFVVFAIDATSAQSAGWERSVFRALYNGESPWPGGAAPRKHPIFAQIEPLLSVLRDARVLGVLAVSIAVCLLGQRLVRAACFFGASLAVIAVNPVLKELFRRPAPFPLPGDYSFPSGHATASMAIVGATVVLAFGTRWRWVVIAAGLLLVLGVGVAGVADGGHWPSDILGGWILASVWIALVVAVVRDPLRVHCS
jgi:membrane-associated phospholipid phosphatase